MSEHPILKAKDYAKRYNDNPTADVLGTVAYDLFLESYTMIEKRKAQKDAALFSIFDELVAKWKAFVRLTNDPSINPDGFELLFKAKMPDIYFPWCNYKKTIKTIGALRQSGK